MFTMLLALQLSLAEPPKRPPGLAPDLAPPVHIMVDGKPLDVEQSGHAAPCVGDFYGDGKAALLVGQYSEGRLRIYRNTGAKTAPKLSEYEWFKASDSLGTIPAG